MASLHRARQGLYADIVCAAVASEGDELERVVDLAALFQHLVCSLDSRHGCRTVGERRMDIAVIICCMRIYECGNLKAAGGVGHDRLVLRLKGSQHASHGDTCSAAGAESVAARQSFGLFHFFFQIICHGCNLLFFLILIRRTSCGRIRLRQIANLLHQHICRRRPDHLSR